MNAVSLTETRYTRRTSLREDEKRVNFRQIDCETLDLLSSPEAAKVTSSMCRIYVKLINAPTSFWEREGVLRLAGEFVEQNGVELRLTAWGQLLRLTQVSGDTLNKALQWMHQQGIIGYHARKNGVGIWIFINRALSSIKKVENQKNLRAVAAPTFPARTPEVGAPFNLVVLDTLDTGNPRAPKRGAETKTTEIKAIEESPENSRPQGQVTFVQSENANGQRPDHAFDVMINQLQLRLEQRLKIATAQAASDAHERTRQWFEHKALPKAVRVGQREAYNVLRKYGLLKRELSFEPQVGKPRVASDSPTTKPRTCEEIQELAEACVAIFEMQGKAIEQTISELCASATTRLSLEEAEEIKKAADKITNRNQGQCRSKGPQPKQNL